MHFMYSRVRVRQLHKKIQNTVYTPTRHGVFNTLWRVGVSLIVHFYRPRVAVAGLDLTLSLSELLTETQMSHFEASNAESAQRKDV